MNYQLRDRQVTVGKRVLWAVVAIGALAALIFWLTPVFTSDPDRLPALSEARSVFFSVIGIAFLIAFVFGTILLGIIEGVNNLLKKITRYSKSIPDVVFRIGILVVPVVVFGVIVLFGTMYAVFIYLHAPSTSLAQITHLDMVKVTERDLRSTGAYDFQLPGARVVGNYLALENNVLQLGLPVEPVFSDNVGPIHDIEVSRETLFVIVGRDLLSVTESKSEVTRVAELPLPAMRFGRRVHAKGLASELLLTGNDGEHGRVYALYDDGGYSKLLDTDANVVSAAGCMDQTAVAFSEEVTQLKPGFRPRLLFRVPAGSEPITSIAARLITDGTADDCLWLVATRHGVYSIQNGAGAVLIAGAGGNLSIGENETLGFNITDPQRNLSLQVSFE